MKTTADRYNHLAQAYIELSDKFHQLDVAHMCLKQKIVPAIKAIKLYKSLTQQLRQGQEQLEETIETLTERQRQLEESQRSLQAKEVELETKVSTLTAEKSDLSSALLTLQEKYDAIADLEYLLQSKPRSVLIEAEEQMALVEETLYEISLNSDPDLSEEEQQLVAVFESENDSFLFSEPLSNNINSLKVVDLLPSVA